MNNDIEFAKKCGATEEEIAALEKQPETASPETVTIEPEKKEYGYKVTPLGNQVFIKPIPKEHPGRLIIPSAYEPSSDLGFLHAVGPDVKTPHPGWDSKTRTLKAAPGLTPGALVMYDKYAAAGNEFELLDEDGQFVKMVRVQSEFVFAVLTRIKV